MEHAGPAIRYRLATDVFPGLLDVAQLEALRLEICALPSVKAIIRKQKDTGAWGGNLLGVFPNKTAGIKEPGTVPQFRRLVEMGLGADARPIRVGARILFRLVSRDEDPKLLFEYAKFGWAEPGDEPWIRGMIREAAASALAHAGLGDDPRVRGVAHKVLNQVSQFVRTTELVDNPFVKNGRAWVLNPLAYPPSVFSMPLLAYLPAVQRERAGLVERLGQYLAEAPTKKAFTISAGKKAIKPDFLLLGDPVHVSSTGQPDDLPFALYWMETLARLGVLSAVPSSAKVWGRVHRESEGGVWHPKNLRTAPKSSSPWAYHMFPLDGDSRKPEARQTDVTFRMALIARLAGMELTQF